MLYSAAGVTFPSQHGLPPMTTQRATFFDDAPDRAQRQRDVRQRAERDELEAGVRADRLDDRVDRVLRLGRALRRRIVLIAEPVAAVKPLARAPARAAAARSAPAKTARPLPHSSTVYSAFRVACSSGTFPLTTVIAATRTSGCAQRHDQRDGVVGGGVGVDEKRPHRSNRIIAAMTAKVQFGVDR